MSTTSTIEWTETTWNPVVGCTHISPGCDNCYAARLASGRLRHTPTYEGLAEDGKFLGKVRMLPERLGQPLRWRKPRRVFVNSMSDLFHDGIPDEFIAEVFAVMAATPRHTYQVLTKRHGRMRSLLRSDAFRWLAKDHYARMKIAGDIPGVPLVINAFPSNNVWLGVSVETQKRADLRIPTLLDTPAAVRFISAEPLLGPVQLDADWLGPRCRASRAQSENTFLDWVITGGESGQGARMVSHDWFRTLRDQCQHAGVAYFHKQNGTKRYGRELDGRTWDEYPGGTA